MGTRRRRVSVIYFISKRDKWDDLRMEFISNCTTDVISNAAKALKDGRLVAFPTETVYGLGADATNEKAVARIYSVKGRPTNHPLIVHISSINKLEDWATDIPDYAIKLAREFWPGPMTLILPRKEIAKNFITGGQNNVGLRVPDQPIAIALLRKFEEMGGQGVAAPSANRFGAVSPTTADAVNEELGSFFAQDDLVLDGGACQIGLESTIIDCTGVAPVVLRPGAITKLMIESFTVNLVGGIEEAVSIRAPGMLKNHYSPKAKVIINSEPKTGEGFIALSSIPTPNGVLRLGSIDSTEQFARDIYRLLRMGDAKGLSKISVILPVEGDLTEAISDRMTKAAAG
jgi:L-threonylcarbamoyladenylate synthase